ncbi:protein CNPPD1-like [Drosophila serrata]|uniref:protein CNPPD1-like n=1 Tax=Drosophila serrata TaxID=7274 RepID=UPI000A1D11A2|nr:protein CNPPD1-like [Drosophila serrata]
MGRSKFASPKKVMQHGDFINRIRKTLYYGVETADTDLKVVPSPLAEYASEIFSEPHRGHSLHRLSCVAAGKIQATPCSLIMALIYLDRLNTIDPGYSCRITPHELFVVSLMISTKFYAGHDERFFIEDWAKEGNMTEDRLKEMELEFLSAVDWNIYISNEDFFAKLNSVEKTLAEREGLRRGWLTYSELIQLLPSFEWTKFLANSFSVLALSYAASVITLASAFFIASQVPGTMWHRRPSTASPSVTTLTLGDAAGTSTASTSSQPGSANNFDNVSDVSCNESWHALNVEEELLKHERVYCTQAIPNETEYTHRIFQFSVPYLPLRRNNFDSEILQDSTQNYWLNIKSQYSSDTLKENLNYFITDSNRILSNLRCQQTRNASMFWQLLTEAMTNSLLVLI